MKRAEVLNYLQKGVKKIFSDSEIEYYIYIGTTAC